MFKLCCLAFLCLTLDASNSTAIRGLKNQDVNGTPDDLKLTSGDLKRFSGYAFNVIESKCPKVKTSTLFDLNKFIGKAIAKDSTPVNGNDAKIQEFLDSMTTCAKAVTPGTDKKAESGIPVIRYFFIDATHYHNIPSHDSAGLELPKHVTANTEETSTLTNKPKLATEIQTEPTGHMWNNPAFTWVSSFFSRIANFFRDIFGSHRRRSMDDGYQIRLAPTPSHMPSTGQLAVEEVSDKSIFTHLFSEIGRIYSVKCTDAVNLNVFKTASSELLKHIFKIVPDKGLELAVKHHITPDFIQSIEQCN